MKRQFVKYHGAGNDFVMVDETQGLWLDTSQIAPACDRRMGIGADGFMTLRSIDGQSDIAYEVRYYNADGQIGSLCGNGSRCAVAWARELGLYEGDQVTFLASDGPHEATYLGSGIVTVDMSDASAIADQFNGSFVDTGSPHHVIITDDVDAIDVATLGPHIRHTHYGVDGSNVNWVSRDAEGQWHIRTYERGVENETLSCGTGAVASALVLSNKCGASSPLTFRARGGDLTIAWAIEDSGTFHRIQLTGPTEKVFEGIWPW